MHALIRHWPFKFDRSGINLPLLHASDGSAAIEYAIMLGILVAGMLVSIQSVGSGTNSLLQMVSRELLSTDAPTGSGFSSPGRGAFQAPTSIASAADGN
jgi:Flp pilus assembly pilin Flp